MKRSTIVIAVAAVLATLVAATAAFAGGSHGKTLFRYVGQVQATSGSSVTVAVQNGNHPALRSMLGQSQVQTFATGEKTVFLKWTKGIPTVVGIGDLAVGDNVTVNIRADRKGSLDTVKATPAATVGDRGQTLNNPEEAALPLPRHVRLGRRRQGDDRRQGRQPARAEAADRPAAQQTFTTGARDGVPPLGAPDPDPDRRQQLKPGDRIVIRVRADRGSTLAQVEATAAQSRRRPRAEGAGGEPERPGVGGHDRGRDGQGRR